MAANTLLKITWNRRHKTDRYSRFNWPVDTVHFFSKQGRPGVIKPIDKKSNYVKGA
jgi:hypothetical protein